MPVVILQAIGQLQKLLATEWIKLGRQWREVFGGAQILQRRVVEHRFCQQPLELGVLILQRPQPLGLGILRATILGPRVVDRRFRQTVPPG